MVLTPTRELAKQIAEQFRVFGRPAGVKVVEVVGGMEMLKQSQQLSEKPHIVVATPGRLADHLDRYDDAVSPSACSVLTFAYQRFEKVTSSTCVDPL